MMTIQELNSSILSNISLMEGLSDNTICIGSDVIGGGWRETLIPVIRVNTGASEELVREWVNNQQSIIQVIGMFRIALDAKRNSATIKVEKD